LKETSIFCSIHVHVQIIEYALVEEGQDPARYVSGYI
jgi:hypothetical protein